jgi:hypothetical protein
MLSLPRPFSARDSAERHSRTGSHPCCLNDPTKRLSIPPTTRILAMRPSIQAALAIDKQ